MTDRQRSFTERSPGNRSCSRFHSSARRRCIFRAEYEFIAALSVCSAYDIAPTYPGAKIPNLESTPSWGESPETMREPQYRLLALQCLPVGIGGKGSPANG
jgi:hypothetical protein